MPSKNAPAEIVAKLTGFAALAAHHALPAIFPHRGFAWPAADNDSSLSCTMQQATRPTMPAAGDSGRPRTK